MQQLPLGIRLADRAVFATFLPGPNAEALAHLEQVAAGGRGAARGPGAGPADGPASGMPVAAGGAAAVTWLAGPPAVGKSHLLQAVCAAAGPSLRVGYFPLGTLAALGPAALDGLPELDCLCLDDVQLAVGRPEWERALFGLHRELEEGGAILVAAARELPSRLAWALPDLGSRFAAAAVFALRPLDEAGQCAALQLRARVRGVNLPLATARWLMQRFPRDLATQYRLLDTLDLAALAAQRRLTVPFIRSVLCAEGTAPGGPAPGGSMADGPVPGDAMPSGSAPGGAVPDDSVPGGGEGAGE